MKNIILLILAAIIISGCSNKVQGLEKSPCACLEINHQFGA
ncbi:hypothetical protein AAX26_01655 [Aliarcobacter thereius]|nr:comB7 lipoprotein [Aliarcobacter thereius]OCL86005.1 hypothetical protein AAX26_01655 [Aliarcobacter thereius]